VVVVGMPACTGHGGVPDEPRRGEPLPGLSDLELDRPGSTKVRFRATTKDAENGKPVLAGAAFEESVGLILCEQSGSECTTGVRYSPVVVEGKLRHKMRDDPHFGGGAGPRWIVEDCSCELSRDGWVPPTEKQLAFISQYVYDHDTLSARSGWNLPLSVVAQVLEGRPADRLDPFAADPERTHQPLWEWRKYWVVEETDDYARNRFVPHE
jgi:hypothetical protein